MVSGLRPLDKELSSLRARLHNGQVNFNASVIQTLIAHIECLRAGQEAGVEAPKKVWSEMTQAERQPYLDRWRSAWKHREAEEMKLRNAQNETPGHR